MNDWQDGYVAVRAINDDDDFPYICLQEQICTWRVVVAPDEFTAGEDYMYDDQVLAILCYAIWPDVQAGWTRHQRPDGSREYPTKKEAG